MRQSPEKVWIVCMENDIKMVPAQCSQCGGVVNVNRDEEKAEKSGGFGDPKPPLFASWYVMRDQAVSLICTESKPSRLSRPQNHEAGLQSN